MINFAKAIQDSRNSKEESEKKTAMVAAASSAREVLARVTAPAAPTPAPDPLTPEQIAELQRHINSLLHPSTP